MEQQLRQVPFHVAIGNNDFHAESVASMHLPTATELARVHDSVPNQFQEGLIEWDLALAVDGVFDHHNMSVGAPRRRSHFVGRWPPSLRRGDPGALQGV